MLYILFLTFIPLINSNAHNSEVHNIVFRFPHQYPDKQEVGFYKPFEKSLNDLENEYNFTYNELLFVDKLGSKIKDIKKDDDKIIYIDDYNKCDFNTQFNYKIGRFVFARCVGKILCIYGGGSTSFHINIDHEYYFIQIIEIHENVLYLSEIMMSKQKKFLECQRHAFINNNYQNLIDSQDKFHLKNLPRLEYSL